MDELLLLQLKWHLGGGSSHLVLGLGPRVNFTCTWSRGKLVSTVEVCLVSPDRFGLGIWSVAARGFWGMWHLGSLWSFAFWWPSQFVICHIGPRRGSLGGCLGLICLKTVLLSCIDDLYLPAHLRGRSFRFKAHGAVHFFFSEILFARILIITKLGHRYVGFTWSKLLVDNVSHILVI